MDVTNPMIPRPAMADDVPAMALIAEATLFPGDMLSDMIAPFLSGDREARWWVIDRGGAVIGFAFAGIEPMTDQAWNLKAIAIDPTHHRTGAGRALLRHVESDLVQDGARVLVIDTSGGDDQMAARAFYEAERYTLSGVIPEFWEPGQDKVTFFKAL